ncbi:MAG: glycosyltransferase [Elusimicrobiota bacterium]
MPLPNQFDLTLGCLIMAGLQLFFIFRFWLRIRRRGEIPPPPDYRPHAAVIIPCAGLAPGFAENIGSILNQDYRGETDYLFVTPRESDPAYDELLGLLARSPRRTTLLASGAIPRRTTGKNIDVLHALERLPAGVEVLVFADADVRVRRGWLGALVGALADPRVGVATALMLYVPTSLRLPPLLRMTFMGFCMPFFELVSGVTGQTLAMRKEDFDALDVAGLWSRCFLEDLALARHVRGWSKSVRFVADAIPIAPDDSSWRETVQVFNKWILSCRVYGAASWILGWIVTGFKAYVLVWGLVHRAVPLLLLLFAMDAAALLVIFALLEDRLPDRFTDLHPGLRPLPLAAAAVAPLLQLLFLVNFVASLGRRRVDWGPYRYFIRGPEDVEAVTRKGRKAK